MKIVCFSPYVPYPGISHAGGSLFQSYLDLTNDLGSRLLVAPAMEHNLARNPDNVDDLRLVPIKLEGTFDRVEDRIAHNMTPRRLPAQVRRSLLRDEITTSALRHADVVEYQWHEMATLLPHVRRLAKQARHVVFLHDVVSQALARAAQREHGRRLLQARAHARLTAFSEARIVSQADAVIVLSPKDAALLKHRENVCVQRPVVRVKQQLDRRRNRGRPPLFAFVAAFRRPENIEAAAWLRNEVWPRIRASISDAELRFVGGDSDRRLAALIDPPSGVQATGYVPDLDAEYARADVALVPILRGAGVKLKTIEAMVTATPSVSTTVGAEGIERAVDFIEIADTPEAFAEAAIRLASDTTGTYTSRADAGARWAGEAHGNEQARGTLSRAITGV
jgi:glycosyltransferase involved in cell wall biosynthesis